MAAVVLDQLIPGLVGLTLGLLGCGAFGRLVALGFLSRRWPIVPGTVTSCQVKKAGRGGQGRVATVSYEYVVGGRRLQGVRVWFGDHLDQSATTAAARSQRFSVGGQVEVRHHPSRPELATIDARASLLAWLGLLACACLVATLVNELFVHW